MTQGADYRVDLDIYNGPLDLLLYLIREREMDIQDIAISEITEQFLAHIEVVKRIDVERAGDFLLVASTLMLIKSRALLPRPEDEDDPNEELDPRTDLVRQLLEYKQFKDAAADLDRAQHDHALRFRSGMRPPKPDAPDAGKLLEDIGVDDLLLAFEKLMRETLADVDHQVFGEVLPLREVETRVAGQLTESGGEVFFRDLFWERRDRFYIVSVFLTLLEMLRRQRIELDPGDDVTELRVRLRTEAEAEESAQTAPSTRMAAALSEMPDRLEVPDGLEIPDGPETLDGPESLGLDAPDDESSEDAGDGGMGASRLP